MTHLRPRDYDAFSKCILELYERPDLARFSDRIFNVTKNIISSSICSYNEINVKINHVAAYTDPPNIVTDQLDIEFMQHLHEHPLSTHVLSGAWQGSLRVSDLVSQRTFENTGIYHDFYRKLDVKHQILLPLWLDRTTVSCLAWNRDRRDFTERDRAILNLLLPHLENAYRIAEIMTKAEISGVDSSSYTDTGDEGIVVLSPQGRVRLITCHAHRKLESYFGRFPRFSLELPTPLAAWVRKQLAFRGDRGDIPPNREPLVRVKDGKRLEVRLISSYHCNRFLLFMQEKDLHLEKSSIASVPGLSPREAQVLSWVARGKTNLEIAMILQIRGGTVKKHLDNIYSKLQVSSRAAAVAAAWDILNLGGHSADRFEA